MKKSLIITFCFSLIGCCYMAPCSSWITVTGKIINESGEVHSNKCELFLVETDGRKLEKPWSEDVAGVFTTQISTAPYGKEYYLQLECDNYKPYKSPVFDQRDYKKEPYDIGEVTLEPAS